MLPDHTGCVSRVNFSIADGGRWDIPELRALLNEVLPIEKAFENFEIAREFGKPVIRSCSLARVNWITSR